MSLIFNGTTVDNVIYNGTTLEKVIYNDVEVFTSAVTVTFVEAGVSTAVKYKKGATVSRSTAPSGATFVGWSMSSSGTSPVATFTANSNMTVYRVIKKSTTYGSGTLTRRWGDSYDQTTNRTQISNEIINGAQVSSISITCDHTYSYTYDNEPVPICIGTTLLGYLTGGTKSFTVPTNVNDYVYLGNNTGVYTIYYDSMWVTALGTYTGRTVTSQYVG